MISEVLKSNSTLTDLELRCDENEEWIYKENKDKKIEMKKMKKWTDNHIGAEGARMISEGLRSNSTLTTLNLRGEENEEWIDSEDRGKLIEMESVMNRQQYWRWRSENDKWRIEK